jgi:tetratricopeptide (TPR) repeat protein
MAARLAEDAALAARTDAALVSWANQRVVTARAAGWREALDELAVERSNLEAALRAAVRRTLDAPHVLQMLDRIWDRDGTGLPADLQQGLEARLGTPLPEDATGLRMVLSIINVTRGIGVSRSMAGRAELADAVLAAVRRLGDTETLVDALSTLAPIIAAAGRMDEARSMYKEAIDLAGEGGPWHRPARDLVNMAVSYHRGRAPLDALPWYEAAVEVGLRTGDEDNRAIALVNMGDVLMTAGRLRQASETLRRGVKAMTHMSRSAAAARVILAEALVRLDEPNSLDFAREAERDLAEISRFDPSMVDYLERLRVTIAASQHRDAER